MGNLVSNHNCIECFDRGCEKCTTKETDQPKPSEKLWPLSARVRPESEAAPWVCDAIKKMEQEHTAAIAEKQKSIEALETALDSIVVEIDRKIKVYDADGIGHSAHSFGATQALEHMKIFIHEALAASAKGV